MDSIIQWLFGASGFTPHGYCLVWQEDLIFLHAASDVLIALSYFIIPFILIRVRRLNPELLPARVTYLFVGFIVSCGITHIFGLITLWEPIYGIAAVSKVACALISIATAIYLIMSHQKTAQIPSVGQLIEVTEKLRSEVSVRRETEAKLREAALNLERRVQDRTQLLNEALTNEQKASARLQDVISMRDKFIASISHDFKTPLNAILGFSETIKLRMFGDKLEGKNADYIDYIHTAGLAMKDFVVKLLDVSRLQDENVKLRVEHFNFSEITRSAYEELSELSTSKSDLTVSLVAAEVIEFIGDKTLCRRLVSNLLSNAIKYTERGKIEVSLHQTKEGIELSVSDTGIGISDEDKSRIFQAFNWQGNLEHANESHGLGLFTAKSIAEQHDGEITLSSEVGVGSTFIVRMTNQTLTLKE